MWHAMAERARLFDGARDRIDAMGGCWRLLVLADDWCGDAVNTLPVIQRLVESSEHLELRVVPRDRFPDIRDRHLTDGGRAIPVVIALDPAGAAVGSWGPRPRALQRLVQGAFRSLSKEERYREVRRWYARDRGASTASEIAELIERSAWRSVARAADYGVYRVERVLPKPYPPKRCSRFFAKP